MELHARTRRDLEPDPEFDPICAVFYCVSSDTALPDTDRTELTGAVVIDKDRAASSQGAVRFCRSHTSTNPRVNLLWGSLCVRDSNWGNIRDPFLERLLRWGAGRVVFSFVLGSFSYLSHCQKSETIQYSDLSKVSNWHIYVLNIILCNTSC